MPPATPSGGVALSGLIPYRRVLIAAFGISGRHGLPPGGFFHGSVGLIPSSTPAPARAGSFTAAGGVEGYASLFGVEDQSRDVVMPGAFRAALRDRGAHQIRMLFQHDPSQPIGAWDDIREDARGLFVRGHIIEAAGRARDILALIRGGALDGLSIGFRARRAARDARTGQRRLYDIDLWEISIVTFPMLPGARVTAIKTCATAAFPLPGLGWRPPLPTGGATRGGVRGPFCPITS